MNEGLQETLGQPNREDSYRVKRGLLEKILFKKVGNCLTIRPVGLISFAFLATIGGYLARPLVDNLREGFDEWLYFQRTGRIALKFERKPHLLYADNVEGYGDTYDVVYEQTPQEVKEFFKFLRDSKRSGILPSISGVLDSPNSTIKVQFFPEDKYRGERASKLTFYSSKNPLESSHEEIYLWKVNMFNFHESEKSSGGPYKNCPDILEFVCFSPHNKITSTMCFRAEFSQKGEGYFLPLERAILFNSTIKPVYDITLHHLSRKFDLAGKK